jgi:TP901 family phage tail tape measure protein
MTTVANLEVQIGLKDTLTKGLATAQKSLSNFGLGVAGVGKGLQTAGTNMSNFGSNLSSSLAPMTDFVTAGIEAAASFESVMTELETFGGLAGDELEAVKQKALDMGAATMFSATDAADAMLNLVKAGMSTTDAMTAVDAAMTLAAVGEMDVANAATIVSTALAQFGIDAEYAGDVVDILAAAANVSAASVQSIADGLANVGPVAASAGLNIAETAAALAVMSNAGIDGAEAGTQLKSLLLNLQGDTAAEQMVGLGISMYDAAGQTRSFDDVLADIETSLSTKTPEEQADIMKNLAGSYGITALNALLAADGIDGTMEAMTEAPKASDLASAAMNTFSGKVEGLQGSVETLMIEALTPLMDNVLSPLVTKVTEIINAMTTWAGENPEVATAIGGVVLALAGLGIGLVVVGGLVSSLGTVFALFGGGLALVLSPIGLIAAGIGAIIVLLNDPGVQAGLSAWEGVFTNAGIIVNAILNDIAVNIRTMITDIRAAVLDAQVLFAEGQINMGFRVAENTAFLESLAASGAGMDIAQKFGDAINGYLAGETVDLDIGGMNWALSGEADPTTGAVAPAGMAQSIVDNIVDPVALQEAITLAMENNDQGALSVLVPVATELGIDVNDLWAQYFAAATEAGALGTAEVTIGAAVTVNPLSIDLSPVLAGINAAASGVGAGGARLTAGMPHLDTGGMVTGDGVAMLHANERVLNPAETKAYDSGGSGGGGDTVIFNGVTNIDDIIYQFKRRGVDLMALAA